MPSLLFLHAVSMAADSSNLCCMMDLPIMAVDSLTQAGVTPQIMLMATRGRQMLTLTGQLKGLSHGVLKAEL